MSGSTWRQRWRDDIRDSDDPRVDIYALAVVWALDRFMSADGRVSTGRRRLAQLARIGSHATVESRLRRLTETGWLTREWAGRGASATYRLAYPVGHSRHEEWHTWATKVAYPTTKSGLPGRPDPGRSRKDSPGNDAHGRDADPLPGLDDTSKRPAKAGRRPDPHRVAAETIVNDWWQRQTPRPQQPWIAAVKIVAKAHRDGWTETELAQALEDVPTVSGAALDLWRNRRNGAGRRSQDTRTVEERLAAGQRRLQVHQGGRR